MKIRNFNKIELYNFKEIIPDGHCINTEATLLIIPDKKYKVFKNFYIDEGPSFSNKLATINTLHDCKDDININEFVYPEELASVDYNIEGYIMEFVTGINLSKILKNQNISLDKKIGYLKQISNVLNKVKKLRNQPNFSNFHIGDIHEDNILVDIYDKVRFLDMDSSKIGGNIPSASKYLVNLKRKGIINDKYKLDDYDNYIIKPNEETDNYCFAVMLLNMIYQENITLNSIEYINNYLDYLKSKGINKELIDIFYNLYTNKPNLDCSEFLDTLDEKIYKLDKYSYEDNKYSYNR